MNIEESKISSQLTSTESFSLTPSSIIDLYEIDISDIVFDLNLSQAVDFTNSSDLVFRFHNSINYKDAIYWRGDKYIMAPISVDGIERTSNGPPQSPKFTITSSSQGIDAISKLRQIIYQIGDISGARFVRNRTFVKYLDAINFIDKTTNQIFTPNPNVSFGKDVFFIDRKSKEDKTNIEFELALIVDIQNIKLPGRLVLANKCNCIYRGNGCLYEYASRRSEKIHGNSLESNLPISAPAIANNNDELITDIIGVISLVDKGKYDINIQYKKGNVVFIEKDGIKYYFAAKIDYPTNPPSDISQWVADSCSKLISGCRLRYSNIGDGRLMANLFAAVNKLRR